MSPERCQMCGAGRTTPVRTLLHEGQCFHLISQGRPRPQQPGVARKVAAAERGHPPQSPENGTESPGKKKEWQNRSSRSKHRQRSQSVPPQCTEGHAAQLWPAHSALKRTPSRSVANGKISSLAGLLHITAFPPLWLRSP